MSPSSRLDVLDESLHLLGIRNVPGDGDAADLAGNRFGGLRARAVVHCDARSGSAELAADRSTDPTRAAGDKRDLAIKGTEVRRQRASPRVSAGRRDR